MKFFILDHQKEIVQTDDPLQVGQFLNDVDLRRVDRTVVGPVEISTVFLVVPASSDHGGLFETMIFSVTENLLPDKTFPYEIETRYMSETYAEAKNLHTHMVQVLFDYYFGEVIECCL